MGEKDFVVGICGGGISGFALALALLRVGIKSIVFEKDECLDARHQGYGLTMQQGGKALKALGIVDEICRESQHSSSHFIFNASDGSPILWWSSTRASSGSAGGGSDSKWDANRNCHIPRQSLRNVLYKQLDPSFVTIMWGSPLISYEWIRNRQKISVKTAQKEDFQVDVLVGCDGIFSRVRSLLGIDDENVDDNDKNDDNVDENVDNENFEKDHSVTGKSLNYLGVFVMLGIVMIAEPWSQLLSERVVQVSDGETRIFLMPFSADQCMWQLSFPLDSLEQALALSRSGFAALKQEACNRCKAFRDPVPLILQETKDELVTGYPVYDRDPLQFPFLNDPEIPITLLGDAAHPMSPFKGQGANQALLDALSLSHHLLASSDDKDGLLAARLRLFEKDMIKRTSNKVIGSRQSVSELHANDFLDPCSQLQRRGFSKDLEESMLAVIDQMKKLDIGMHNPADLDKLAFPQSTGT